MSTDLMTAALEEAYASCPTNVAILDTIQIDHSSFTVPIRLVNNHDDMTATLETGETVLFTRFAFGIVKPEVNAQGVPVVVITVDGASGEIAEVMNSLADSPDYLPVTIRSYRSDNLSVPAGRNIPGEIRSINVKDLRVTLRIGFKQVANLGYPNELYTPSRFPGLVR